MTEQNLRIATPTSFSEPIRKGMVDFINAVQHVQGCLLLSLRRVGQEVAACVKVKPGIGLKYANWLATECKTEQEALKNAGLILDYKVIESEAHGTTDWDVMLMTEYKDLTTMEAQQDKREDVANKATKSDDQKMIAGYEERASWREIEGNRLAREIILEPKK